MLEPSRWALSESLHSVAPGSTSSCGDFRDTQGCPSHSILFIFHQSPYLEKVAGMTFLSVLTSAVFNSIGRYFLKKKIVKSASFFQEYSMLLTEQEFLTIPEKRAGLMACYLIS